MQFSYFFSRVVVNLQPTFQRKFKKFSSAAIDTLNDVCENAAAHSHDELEPTSLSFPPILQVCVYT